MTVTCQQLSDLVADVNTLEKICIGWGGKESPFDGIFISVFGAFLFPQLLNLVTDFGSESIDSKTSVFVIPSLEGVDLTLFKSISCRKSLLDNQ